MTPVGRTLSNGARGRGHQLPVERARG